MKRAQRSAKATTLSPYVATFAAGFGSLQADLAKFGNAGWEVIGIGPQDGGLVVVWKKPPEKKLAVGTSKV